MERFEQPATPSGGRHNGAGPQPQIDVAGPFLVKTKSKQAVQTRQEKREKKIHNKNVDHAGDRLLHI